MKLRAPFTIAMLAVVLAGCDVGPKSGRGFRLPDGNPDKGKAAFVALKCYTCHKVDGVEGLPAPVARTNIVVTLGGGVTQLRTYGDLVTSIINPSHRFSEKFKKEFMEGSKLSPMGEFNEVMTVAQMIDLVAFLQPRYKEIELPVGNYP